MWLVSQERVNHKYRRPSSGLYTELQYLLRTSLLARLQTSTIHCKVHIIMIPEKLMGDP